MSSLEISAISTAKYHDGSDVIPGHKVIPVLLLVNENNRITMIKGDTIVIDDTEPPVIADFAVSQGESNYVYTPYEGTVTDNTGGNLSIYHIIVLSREMPLTADQLLTIAMAHPSDVGTHVIVSNTPGQVIPVSGMSLATSKVYTGNNTFREIAEGDSVVNVLLAADLANHKSVSAIGTGDVLDNTAPVMGALSIGTVGSTSVQITGLQNITDANLASVDIHYNTSDSLEGASNLPVTVTANAVASDAFSVSPLADATQYWFWAEAADIGGNKQFAHANQIGTATTLDITALGLASFDVTQRPDTHVFAVDAGSTVSDNVDGNVNLYLVMSADASLDTATLQTMVGVDGANIQASAKNLSYNYTGSPSPADIGSLLSTDQYHDGSSFVSISTDEPAYLHAYLLAVDAGSNATSIINAGGIKSVKVVDNESTAYNPFLLRSTAASGVANTSGSVCHRNGKTYMMVASSGRPQVYSSDDAFTSEITATNKNATLYGRPAIFVNTAETHLYMLFQDTRHAVSGQGYRLSMSRLNLSTLAWEDVLNGFTAASDNGGLTQEAIFEASDGQLVLVFGLASNVGYAYTHAQGTTTATSVGTSIFDKGATDHAAFYGHLDSDDVIYAGFSDATHSRTFWWELGVSSEWAEVGTGIATSGDDNENGPRMVSDGGILYRVHYDGVSKSTVQYNTAPTTGGSWAQLGSDDNPLLSTQYCPAISIVNGKVTIAGKDTADNLRVNQYSSGTGTWGAPSVGVDNLSEMVYMSHSGGKILVVRTSNPPYRNVFNVGDVIPSSDPDFTNLSLLSASGWTSTLAENTVSSGVFYPSNYDGTDESAGSVVGYSSISEPWTISFTLTPSSGAGGDRNFLTILQGYSGITINRSAEGAITYGPYGEQLDGAHVVALAGPGIAMNQTEHQVMVVINGPNSYVSVDGNTSDYFDPTVAPYNLQDDKMADVTLGQNTWLQGLPCSYSRVSMS